MDREFSVEEVEEGVDVAEVGVVVELGRLGLLGGSLEEFILAKWIEIGTTMAINAAKSTKAIIQTILEPLR